MFSRDTYQYLEAFNCVQIKLLVESTWNRSPICKIELLVLDMNTYNYVTMCKWMNSVD